MLCQKIVFAGLSSSENSLVGLIHYRGGNNLFMQQYFLKVAYVHGMCRNMTKYSAKLINQQL
jgi:hypothetical protein